MVAKIKSGKSIIGALNYNEIKVRNHKAELIEAANYFKDLQLLGFNDKLFRLTDMASGNQRTKTNAVHISLNFANGEDLETALLRQIIGDYMEQIGFGNQPYLAYKHSDAGHPHVHIVTTNIQSSGERISLHLLGKTKSEPARKAIEVKYDLRRAGNVGEEQGIPERINLKRLEYGKTETKRALTNLVSEVIKSYKFTSLPEMNAILNQFNAAADRGSKDSKMYEKNGLVYWVLDEKGDKIGVPIKASSIFGKPTLKTLEDRFKLNEILRKPLKEQVKNCVDEMLIKSFSQAGFQKALYEKGIQAVLRQNNDGRLYGVTFVDHKSKVVFNGSDLGKQYSAAMLSQKFLNQKTEEAPAIESKAKSPANPINLKNSHTENHAPEPGGNSSLLDILFTEEQQDLAAINRLKQNKRKKKRKGNSL